MTTEAKRREELTDTACYAFERFIPKTTHRGKHGILRDIEVGEIRLCHGKTRTQVWQMIRNRQKKYGETFSWDQSARPIAVRRDT